MELYCGATLIVSQEYTCSRLSWTQRSKTLSSGEADSITDYTDLRIKLTHTSVTTGQVYCGRAYFECDDAAAPAGARRIFIT